MQRGKVAVEDNLTPVRDLLQQKGFEVVSVDRVQDADYVVLTGGDDNIMGIQTIMTKAPVITAEGRTAEEIVAEIERLVR
jgi:hypothetical protein